MQANPILSFDQYELYPLSSSEVDSFYTLVSTNRPRLEAFFAGLVMYTQSKEDTLSFLQGVDAKRADRTYLPYILKKKGEQAIACFLDIKNINWRIPKAEIGCFADEQQEGKKLTQVALQHFVAFCFHDLGFLKLFLRTHEANMAARTIAEKTGFELEGKIRKDYKSTSGEVVDLLYYGQINPNL